MSRSLYYPHVHLSLCSQNPPHVHLSLSSNLSQLRLAPPPGSLFPSLILSSCSQQTFVSLFLSLQKPLRWHSLWFSLCSHFLSLQTTPCSHSLSTNSLFISPSFSMLQAPTKAPVSVANPLHLPPKKNKQSNSFILMLCLPWRHRKKATTIYATENISLSLYS